MSQPKKPTVLQVTEAQDALNDLAIGKSSKLTWQEAFDILEAAPSEGLQTVNASYFEIALGQTYNMVFDGFSKIMVADKNGSGDMKEVECAILLDKEGNKFLAGQSVLVSACRQLTRQPSWIRIIVADKKIKSGKGDYFDVTVKTF